MKLVIPIFAMVVTAIATLTSLVFCMAAGANSTPAEIRALKLWMVGLSILGAAGIAAGIILIRVDSLNWAAVAAIAPTIIFGIILSIALLK